MPPQAFLILDSPTQSSLKVIRDRQYCIRLAQGALEDARAIAATERAVAAAVAEEHQAESDRAMACRLGGVPEPPPRPEFANPTPPATPRGGTPAPQSARPSPAASSRPNPPAQAFNSQGISGNASSSSLPRRPPPLYGTSPAAARQSALGTALVPNLQGLINSANPVPIPSANARQTSRASTSITSQAAKPAPRQSLPSGTVSVNLLMPEPATQVLHSTPNTLPPPSRKPTTLAGTAATSAVTQNNQSGAGQGNAGVTEPPQDIKSQTPTAGGWQDRINAPVSNIQQPAPFSAASKLPSTSNPSGHPLQHLTEPLNALQNGPNMTVPNIPTTSNKSGGSGGSGQHQTAQQNSQSTALVQSPQDVNTTVQRLDNPALALDAAGANKRPAEDVSGTEPPGAKRLDMGESKGIDLSRKRSRDADDIGGPSQVKRIDSGAEKVMDLITELPEAAAVRRIPGKTTPSPETHDPIPSSQGKSYSTSKTAKGNDVDPSRKRVRFADDISGPTNVKRIDIGAMKVGSLPGGSTNAAAEQGLPTAFHPELEGQKPSNQPGSNSRSKPEQALCVCCGDTVHPSSIARVPCNHEYCQSCIQRVVINSLTDQVSIHLAVAIDLSPSVRSEGSSHLSSLVVSMRRRSNLGQPTVPIARFRSVRPSSIHATSMEAMANARKCFMVTCTSAKGPAMPAIVHKTRVPSKFCSWQLSKAGDVAAPVGG